MKPIVSDTILRDTVIKELDDDPEVAAKHISVTAIDGAITLAGHVMTIHEKHVAVRAAERIRAVRAIADDIEVREPSLHERADDEIAEEIAHLRSWGAEIPDSVAAQVRDGRVILHGDVESTSQRDTAESAVRQLTGVRVVDNLIRVKALTKPTAADVEHRVQEAIGRTADLAAQSMRMRIKEPDMTIDHAESHAIIPDGMRRTADAYQSSPAVSVAGGRLIFVSGQVGSDEAGQPIADPEAQFVAAIENLRDILEAAGGTLADVVEMTTYFTSMADLPVFAKVKERFFTTTPYPAWTGIGVNELALPGLRVEIKATASLKNPAGPQP